ncbi:MAG TPA: phosphotransferase [Steroidobacteraceae bacterium]
MSEPVTAVGTSSHSCEYLQMSRERIDAVALAGGRTTPGVIRIGDAVHRPASSRSAFVAALLGYLESIHFAGVPRYLGQDSHGRDVFSFLPGEVPSELGFIPDAQLRRAAGLIRAFHDATIGFEGKGAAEVVCHGDLSPCNCVFQDGSPCGFIDFDSAAPGSRADDLGYAAWLWLDLGNDEISAQNQRRRLSLFVDAYGQDVGDLIPFLLAAQSRLALDPRGAAPMREWAKASEAWTRRHLAGFAAQNKASR